MQLDHNKMEKLSNKFTSAGYNQFVLDQKISFYVLSAKFIDDNEYNFNTREAMDILNKSIKTILIMKLISFEDLDYDRIIHHHQIID